MSFRERERQRLIKERDRLFKDPGLGLFSHKPRDFVLSEAAANLWEGIRADAIQYFARNKIPWWNGDENGPTGHILSSQVSCVNHLYLLRQRPDLAKAVLRAIDSEIVEAEVVDYGCVEFEFIGKRQYLKEREFSRGTNCTSIDAFMIGRTAHGSRRAFLVEWKYTEIYRRQDKYNTERAAVYDDLIRADDLPFKPIEPQAFYFEPFYQMMRQTLLGWQISKHEDYGCTSYRHIHVVPEQNAEFHRNITAPLLKGASVSEAWWAVLKRPEFYLSTTPANFMRPVLEERDTKALTGYLTQRYWSGI